jgi:5-methylcytosine-specific restriction endonuclease McrA
MDTPLRVMGEGDGTCAGTIQGEPCGKPALSRGLCSGHYTRSVGGSDMDAAWRTRKKKPGEECSIEGCGYVGRLKKGMCDRHYARFRRLGDPGTAESLYRFGVESCEATGCEESVLAHGLCPKHYSRLKRTGTTDTRSFGRKYPTDVILCQVEVCNRPAIVRGWCRGHYNRYRATGEAGTDPIREWGRPECLVTGCEARPFSRGLCADHYAHEPDQMLRAAEKSNRRRARKTATAVVWPIPPELIQARIDFYGGRCYLCGAGDVALEMDHVIPLSRGGQHVAANLRPACVLCNRRKAAEWPVDTSTAHLRLDPSRLP